MPLLHDDVARISPEEASVSIDVLANDELGGFAPSELSISIVNRPATGRIGIIPASARTGGRPRLLFTQTGSAGPLAPGQEVAIYYTVNAPGVLSPTPASILIVGAGSACSAAFLHVQYVLVLASLPC